MRDLMEQYLRHLESLRYSPQTLRKTRGVLRGFIEWLGRGPGVARVERLRAQHLKRWHTYVSSERTVQGRPLKAASVNRHLVAVRGWLESLARDGHVHPRLVENLPYVKEPHLLPGSVLSHAQMRKLLASISTDSPEGYRNRAMLEVLYSSGVRVGELLGLDTGDVDLRGGTMRVTGKGGKERVVPIGRTARKALKSYVTAVRPFMTASAGEKALFVSRDGRRLGYLVFWRFVHAAATRTGIDVNVTPHTFRRSCATELIRGGANMYHVKELLGHEKLDTLKHYARLTITDLRKTHAKCHPRERDGGEEGIA